MPLPSGRSRLSQEEVAENHRRRILFATASVAASKGYTATTVTDITELAGLDGRAFYALFTDKQDAFMATHEFCFQQLMAVTATAFSRGTSWPEHVWEAGRAFTQFFDHNPDITKIGFVEAYAGGAGPVQRSDDVMSTFTIFLQEGYQYQPQTTPPSPLALEAIAATNFEIAYRQVRASSEAQLSGLLPYVAHICLTPFLGAAKTNKFIDEKMRTTATNRTNPGAA